MRVLRDDDDEISKHEYARDELHEIREERVTR